MTNEQIKEALIFLAQEIDSDTHSATGRMPVDYVEKTVNRILKDK